MEERRRGEGEEGRKERKYVSLSARGRPAVEDSPYSELHHAASAPTLQHDIPPSSLSSFVPLLPSSLFNEQKSVVQNQYFIATWPLLV